MVLKTMSSNEAKQNWGSVMSTAGDHNGAVIVESHGKPRVVVIPYNEYQDYQEFREKRKRAELAKQLDDLEARFANHTGELTEAEIEEIAVAVGREINWKVADQHRKRMAEASRS